MIIPSSSTLLTLVASLSLTNALKFPLERRTKGNAMKFSAEVPSLPTFSAHSGDESGDIGNSYDLVYTVDINICGQEINVQLDTGSTDLWVKPPTPLKGVEETKLTATFKYGLGDVTGVVAICPVELGDYSIPKQAFLSHTSSHFEHLFAHKTYGILGLGFDSLSTIYRGVVKQDSSATWGRSVLTNLFYANPKTPNYVAFLLDRASDLDTVSEGSFYIGETETKYAAVIKEPALPVFPDENVSRWTVVLDSVTVNGKAVPAKSTVKGAPAGKTVALLDTGASFVLGPKAAIDAIYSGIPGAYYYHPEKAWAIPCLSDVLVQFVFGGKAYSVHPLDLTIVMGSPDGKGTICLATFREFDIASVSGQLDWLVGDAFLRNVYSMYDFGDLDTSTGGLVGHPFIKLLAIPTSEYKAASSEYKTARAASLAELPPQIAPSELSAYYNAADYPAAASSGSTDPQTLAADTTVDQSTLNDLYQYMEKVIKYMPILLGLLGGMTLILLIVLIISIVTCARRGKGRTYTPISH